MFRFVLSVLLAVAFGSDVAAQHAEGRTPTSRGRISDSTTLQAAQEAMSRSGTPCIVERAMVVASSRTGDRHYEVTCRDGLGYFLAGGRTNRAYSCLLLASQHERLSSSGAATRHTPTCELPSNTDAVRQTSVLAREAGVTCRTDEGRVIGLSVDNNPIYEIGCRGEVGVWIEQTRSGWLVEDCIDVMSRGDACQFTSEDERNHAFTRWLAGSAAEECEPGRTRSMGRNAAGTAYFELLCGNLSAVVVGLDQRREVVSVRSCAEAAHIGDGCRFASMPRP